MIFGLCLTWKVLTLRIYVVFAPPLESPKIRVFPQAAPILDFIWYPRATPHDGSSFCFVASVRESPVRLLDASDGRVSHLSHFFSNCVIRLDGYVSQLRASYKIVDHRERQIAPNSLAFNVLADKYDSLSLVRAIFFTKARRMKTVLWI